MLMSKGVISKSNTGIHESFSFSVGQLFRRGPTIFEIVEKYGDVFVLRHAETHERKFIKQEDLISAYLEHELVPSNEDDVRRSVMGDPFSEDDDPVLRLNFVDASGAAIKHGSKLSRYIMELKNLGYSCLRPTPILRLEFERLRGKLAITDGKFRECTLTLDTVYKTSLKVDKTDGDWRAAVPNYADRGGRGKKRISPIAQKCLNKEWSRLRANKKATIKYSDIEKELKGLIGQEVKADEIFMIMPKRSTIERLTKEEFGQHEIDRRNRGDEFVKKKYKSHYPRDRVMRPLEVVEFDDKDTRVFLVNEMTGLPDGRAYVTAGVDQETTVPLGFSISDQPRNTFSAISACVNSILPCNTSLPEYSQVESGAEFYGDIGISIFDNTLFNHSNAMEKALAEISNTVPAWAKPYTPTEKANVENFFGRMERELLPTLPGYGGRKGEKKGLQKGLEGAVMATGDFKELFFKWAYDIYCNTPRGDGLTPRQLWHKGMRNTSPRVPLNLHKVIAAVSIPHELRIRGDGILFTGLPYQNPRLEVLTRKLGHNAKIYFRYHPEKLEQIYVYDPFASEYFVVASVIPEYIGGLTYAQHILIRKMHEMPVIKIPPPYSFSITKKSSGS